MANRTMDALDRRTFLKLLGASGLTTLGACANTPQQISLPSSKKTAARVVIVGGGFGGATAAQYLKKFLPDIDVTLIEYQEFYTTGPGSNWVLGGLRHVDSITFAYDDLEKKHGINVVKGWVTTVDTEGRNVRLSDGHRIQYDRLILSPGIDLDFDAVEGYGEMDVNQVPHAWKAGMQTAVLRQQLTTMRDGGTMVIAPPEGPQRCPAAVYERASMVAHYLKSQKPKSKILILDSKDDFPSQTLFTDGWEKKYGYGTKDSIIERVSGAEARLTRVDVRSRTAYAGPGEDPISADVLNVIPPQKAGAIAFAAGVTDDTGWCPVNQRTWESLLVPGIYVIGDAAIADPVPKTGFSANAQGKVCAAAIASDLGGQTLPTPTMANTCYSLISPKYGISSTMVYTVNDENKIMEVDGAGGNTPKQGDFENEARYVENWWYNITEEIFG